MALRGPNDADGVLMDKLLQACLDNVGMLASTTDLDDMRTVAILSIAYHLRGLRLDLQHALCEDANLPRAGKLVNDIAEMVWARDHVKGDWE